MVRTLPTVSTWFASKHPRNACVHLVVDGDDDSKHVAILLIGDTGTAEPPFECADLPWPPHRVAPRCFGRRGSAARAVARTRRRRAAACGPPSQGARTITNDFDLALHTARRRAHNRAGDADRLITFEDGDVTILSHHRKPAVV
jgi:hypothetical protein